LSDIHPSAIVAQGATIGAGVRIGPFCTVGPDVVLEDGVTLVSHAVVEGHTRLGPGVTVSPFASIGLPPQDLKYRGEPTRCEIGARTLIREHVTVHRGTPQGPGVTRVGADCMLMNVVHVAHDCRIADGVIIANNVVMGGHVDIAERAIIGGAVAIHQGTRIGRHAMVGGMAGVEADVIPFGLCRGPFARLRGLNLIGLKRRGFPRPEIHALRNAVRTIFGNGGGTAVTAERVAEVRVRHADSALVAEVLAFMDATSRRGLMRARLVPQEEDFEDGAG
jgi:UDP-N-acetylglucosamine acyltransferase